MMDFMTPGPIAAALTILLVGIGALTKAVSTEMGLNQPPCPVRKR